ncbi:iron-containing redox enzyme family protein [Candidatus Woesearchaeota archaeon]|nr:iron-containing redox enzyme family protein [Candidatus Woesearchaeota archaeon]
MTETLNALQYLVDENPILQHPLLVSFADLRKSQVKSWAREQYYLSLSFADTLAILFARVPFTYVAEKRQLADMFYTEVRGGNDLYSHEAEFAAMASFLELNLEQLQQERPKTHTQQFIDDRLALCSQKPIAQSLAAMALGNEYLNLSIFKSYRDGIPKISGLASCPLGYFDAHLRDEYDDFKIMDAAFQKVSSGLDNGVERAVRKLLEIRTHYFDALWEDLK